MKKRLLFAFVALMAFVGAKAYELGDYVYTSTAKYKVVGENLVQNGKFASTDSWTSTTDGTFNPDNWSLETDEGATCVKSLSAADGATLYQAVPIEHGHMYIISMKIKAGEEGPFGTVTTDGAVGHVDVYANADGQASKASVGYTQIAGSEAVFSDWTSVAFAFNDTIQALEEAGLDFVNIVFEKLPVGTMITDVEVSEVVEVYDTRKADRVLNYAKTLVAMPEFEEGARIAGTMEEYENAKAEYQEFITLLEEGLSDPMMGEDPGTMEALVEAVEDAQNAYLDGCAGDMKGTTGDWNNIPYNKNAASLSSYGYWKVDGGRGFSRDASRGDNGRPYLAASIAGNGSYGLNFAVRVTDENQTVKLAPGKYFFSIDAEAFYYGSTKATNYTPDYSKALVGPTLFVGRDTVTLENDTVPGRYWKTYYKIAEITAEDSIVSAGIIFPSIPSGTVGGGEMRASRAQFRLIGQTAAALARAAALTSFKTQQGVLKERLDRLTEELASADYPWAKDSIQRAYDACLPVYQETLTYVDADGNDLLVLTTDQLTEYSGNNGFIVAAVRQMDAAYNYYHSANQPYVDLKNEIAEAQAVQSNAAYANADKTQLNAAIAEAQALFDAATTTKTEADAEEYNTMVASLHQTVADFKMANATYENPGEIVIDDPFFAKVYTPRNGTTATNSNWVLTSNQGASNKGGWNSGVVTAQDGSTYEGGISLYVARASKTQSRDAVKQVVTINKKGYYEYRAQVHGVCYYQNQYEKMIQTVDRELEDGSVVTDTIYQADGVTPHRLSGVKMIFGPENAPDSLDIADNVIYTETFADWAAPQSIGTISLFFEKAADGEENVEIGLDGTQNGDVNWAKGNITTWSSGAVEKGFGFSAYGFGGNHIYYYPSKEVYDNGRSGIQAITEQKEKVVSKGIYNMNGVRVNNFSQKGIYIVNGKKVVIK